MRERVEMLGGQFAITSAPGKGTTIRAEIPFRSAGRKPLVDLPSP
jgi:signal transduction histidine kinase